jgi:hypothetical protein
LAARFVEVHGKRYPLHGVSVKAAKEVLKFELPLGVGDTQKVFIDVTRIEAINWVHNPVYGEVQGLRVRSVFNGVGNLVWGENYGQPLNEVIDEVRMLYNQKAFLDSALVKAKLLTSDVKYSKIKELKTELKPVERKIKVIKRILKHT